MLETKRRGQAWRGEERGEVAVLQKGMACHADQKMGDQHPLKPMLRTKNGGFYQLK